jgi:low temperature requirement protein LtrA
MLDEVTQEELLEGPVEREQRVTALELFFDLVFVFALTQVTGFLYHDPSWLRLLEALALLMVLWISWSGYLWLGNTMGAVLVVSFAVPNAFGKDALVFGVAFFFVRGLHIVAYVVIAAGDRALRAAVARMARTELPAAAVLVLAGLLPSAPRAACWVPAVLDGQSPSRRASVRL